MKQAFGRILIALLLTSIVVVTGCTSTSNDAMAKESDVMGKEPNAMMENKTEGTMMEKNESAMMSYSGAVLAGTVSPVVEFNMNDYQAAIGQNKLILLYFYANWCPVCKAEVPELYTAFSELSDQRVIAFRVNFNDDQTSQEEVEMARAFGVPYQHTKVIVKNGQAYLKSTEGWNKNRYLFEVNKALNMP